MSDPVGGVDWNAFQNAVQAYVVAATALPPTSVVFGQQTGGPRVAGPSIVLRISNIAEMGGTWLDWVANPLTFTTVTIQSISGSTATAPAHGLLTGDGPITIASTGTMPGGLVADTNYWIIAPDANTLQFAASYANTGGGQGAGNPTTPITLTGPGSGTITISDTPDTLRAGQELLAIARGFQRVSLELHAHTAVGVGNGQPQALLQMVKTRRTWPSQEAILQNANIGLLDVDRIRAIQGVKDAVIFEPRAYLELHLCVPFEEAQPVTIIDTVVVGGTVTVPPNMQVTTTTTISGT